MTATTDTGRPVDALDVAVWLGFCADGCEPVDATGARRKVMRLRHDGVIPAVKGGREWRFGLADGEAALRGKAWASVHQTEGTAALETGNGHFQPRVTPGCDT